MHKKRMIAFATKSPNFQPIFLIPSSISIHNDTISLMIKILDSKLFSHTECNLIHFNIILIPVDSISSLDISNNSIILSGSTGFLWRISNKCTIWTNLWYFCFVFILLFLCYCYFVQLWYSIFINNMYVGLKRRVLELKPRVFINLVWGYIVEYLRIKLAIFSIFYLL